MGLSLVARPGSALCPNSPPIEASEVTIDALFVPGKLEWDSQLISDLFSGRDCEEILSIPLPKSGRDDIWFWCWTPKGNYSVKSGYHFLKANANRFLGPLSTDWSAVWALQLPPKIRNFIWRALSNNLPTKEALVQRRINLDPTCSLCNTEIETSLHVLVNCPVVQCIWAAAPVRICDSAAPGFVSWWNDQRRVLSKQQLDIVAAILWCCWWNRNELIWNGESKSAASVINKATITVAEYKSIQEKLRRVISAASSSRNGVSVDSDVVHTGNTYPNRSNSWVKPHTGFFKCNVDASLFPASSKYGFGGLIRDHNGAFREASQGSFYGRVSPVVAEAVGLREVLSWLKDKQENNIQIEVDSKLVADAMNKMDDERSYFGIIMDDCKALLRDLNQCSVSFIYRSANYAAHSLARAAISVSGWKVWDTCPAFVHDVMINDLY